MLQNSARQPNRRPQCIEEHGSLAVTAAAVAGPAFAQGDNRTVSQTSPNLDDAEKTHAEKTATIGTASLTMAKLALKRPTAQKSGNLEKSEQDEQITVAAILKTIDPSLTASNPPRDVGEAIDNLKNIRGSEFDREFVAAQVQGHEMLRSIQEDYLKQEKADNQRH